MSSPKINANDYELVDATLSPSKREDHYHDDEILPTLDLDDTLVEESKEIDREIHYQGSIIRLYPSDPRNFIVQTQIVVLLFVFTTLGLNGQATGMLIPVLSETYGISQVVITNIFLIQTVGYFSACFLTESIHTKYGQRGCLSIACLCIGIPSMILFSKPPIFFMYVLCCYPIGIGIGLLDSAVNYVFSSFVCYKNELLGSVHGVYGICSFLTPILINALGEENWNKFFLLQGSVTILGAALCFYVFRYETSLKYEYKVKMSKSTQSSLSPETNISILQMMRLYPLVPLYACALFFYMGSEVGTASWMYTYLLEYKEGNSKYISWILSAYWAGLTLGRFYFGMMIDKWFTNEYQAVKFFIRSSILCTLSVALLGVIYSHSTIYYSMFGVALFGCGMFIGPIFPLLSIIGVDILDEHVQVRGLSSAISLGSIGSAFMPFLDVVIMHHLGLSLLPTLILIATVLCAVAIHMYPNLIHGRDHYFNPRLRSVSVNSNC
ncbi:uncharacterized protein HGUI_03632 [Hanseniaspora guilliermondii]|uniref:Major facilitator superfamily (MFS) profile domain-containing protein n=1 Tax=Hanseniaspora guilliermondii TaxID=56406 RepID=A0A1L0D2P1_9ASCO|nr:uncharacterized protein HGUI_03632 [Hanseniaspora guilliermondii]